MAEEFVSGFRKVVEEIPLVDIIYISKEGVCLTRDFIPFIILKIEAYNTNLLTEEEKKDFAEKIMEILNALHKSKKVVIFSQTVPLDVSLTIKEFAEAIRESVITRGEEAPATRYLQEQQKLWSEYASTTKIVTSYITIFYSSPTLERRDKLSAFEAAYSYLLNLSNVIEEKFLSIGVTAKRMKSDEILQIIWEFFHPRTSVLYENKAKFSLDDFVVHSTRNYYEF